MLIKLLLEVLFLSLVQSGLKKKEGQPFVSKQETVRGGVNAISNCSAVSPSSSAILLLLPHKVIGHGVIDSFNISYRPTHIETKEWKSVNEVAGDKKWFTIKGLMENMYYDVVVRNQTSEVVCQVTIKTKREESLRVENVQVKTINNSAMSVKWSPLKGQGIFIYQVYQMWTSEGRIRVSLVCKKKKTWCIVDLKPKIKVPHSIFVNARRINSSTAPISNGQLSHFRLSLRRLTWDSVKASWTKPSENNTFDYHLLYWYSGSSVKAGINTSSNEVTVSKLKQLKTYVFKVVIFGKGGGVALTSNEEYITFPDRNECQKKAAVCSVNALCINTEGSYYCRCRDGYTGNGKSCTASSTCKTHLGKSAKWSTADVNNCVSKRIAGIDQKVEDPDAELLVVAENLRSSTSSADQLLPGDLIKATEIIQKLTAKKLDAKVLGNGTKNEIRTKANMLFKSILESSSNILNKNSTRSWDYVPEALKKSTATELIKSIDSLALNVARIMSSHQPFTIETPGVVLSVQSFPEDVKDDYTFPSLTNRKQWLSSRVILPANALRKQSKYGDGNHYVTFVSFESLGLLMSPEKVKSEVANEFVDSPGPVNSPVVSLTVEPLYDNQFDSPVVLIFKHTMVNQNSRQPTCVFWNVTSTPAVWSREGCRLHTTNKSHTVCHCYHLTSFAVLMQTENDAEANLPSSQEFALSLVTYICVGISVAALVITFLTFSCFRSVRSTRHFVHANLALSLSLAELLFLVGIQRTENQVACRVVAVAMHYLFLVSFAWMMIEGVVLYLMLVKVFQSKMSTTTKNAIFCCSSWGIPAVIVGVCAALYPGGYGTKRYCWLSVEKGFVWSFVGPVLCTVAFNFLCLFKTCGIIGHRKDLEGNGARLKKIKLWAKATVLLTCLLGLTWILGVFFLNEQWVVIAYLFNILCGLQGLMIFLCHCLLDKKVRVEYKKLFCPKTLSSHRSLKEEKSSELLLRKLSPQRRSWTVTSRMSRTSFKTNFERRSTCENCSDPLQSPTNKDAGLLEGEDKILETTPMVGKRVRSINYDEMLPVLYDYSDNEPPSGASQETIEITDKADGEEAFVRSYISSTNSSPSLTEGSMGSSQCSPKERSRRESLV